LAGPRLMDLDALVAAATEAAEAAGAAIRPHFRSGLAADLKSDESPVTLADRAAEQAMRAVLAARFPDHGILGEEFGRQHADRRFRWVLDPIDGTRAFITGRPIFGSLIALLDGETPIIGLIDQPVTGERWLGVAGHPTRFTGPFGGAAGCRPRAGIAEAELSATAPEMFDADESASFRRLAGAVRRVSWGGDCYAYGLLALGQIDIVAESGLQMWDWAALVPVIEGAGGRMTDWAGNKLRGEGRARALAVGDPCLLETASRLLTS
jgi:histidinol phosphatase-like enzyme (inositol monophosphatase family)